jgi:hypothetical protein
MSADRDDGHMKTTKAAKDERRAHRKARDRRRQDERMSMRIVGGAMDPGAFEGILAAALGLDAAAPWEAMAPKILPVLKRVHQPYPPEAAPLLLHVPPGLWTGFGIDFGPAFSHVSAAMLEGWGVDEATLLGTALENLRELIVREPPRIQRFEFEGVGLVGVQGQGWGSSLLLLPDALGPILGANPRLLLAPVRNTLVSLPGDVDIDLAAGVWHALADGAHDELDVEPLRWTGTSVVSLGDPARGLPN